MFYVCPCQSKLAYDECCKPFHFAQKLPITAEELMRSRYSAYTKVNIDYIVRTTLPAQQSLLDLKAIRDWSQKTQWIGLDIISNQENVTKIHSIVEFRAYFNTEDGVQIHHECSLFVNVDDRWYFFDPTVPMPAMKKLCICRSGKRFKDCCGRWI
ncbi:YchJ family protein [Glaesserella parasuis]|uniref:YchJ family protein n=1 Tax=Glaesserella parasuis TaxID=738 RepID=A0A084EVN2_GLAPU|nr:YchJ family protein [Glaesserella parasuis]AMW16298.1 preprotein translocase subunit SecA [Glaesserella parasuis]ATW42603.1 SEC-C motif-containing protein [Glaesserella parasuis D74]AWY46272.1 SEC-C motif-containing protein [Glaesserella parasuis 29755]KDD81385.1 preprotein translocase subunit SecA [Glaesserella parasuis ST4-1]KEZ22024.1 hypothetical protein HS327_01507 [Glaesserella parasuis]